MFDVDVGGVAYRESAHEQPGDEIVIAEAGGVAVGLTVCYDLRFPELYRILAVRGARADHRPGGVHAGDRQATTGRCCCARGRSRTRSSSSRRTRSGRRRRTTDSYGRSLIVDPWGVVLATAPDEECFVAAELELEPGARSARRCPRSRTAGPAPTNGRELGGGA